MIHRLMALVPSLLLTVALAPGCDSAFDDDAPAVHTAALGVEAPPVVVGLPVDQVEDLVIEVIEAPRPAVSPSKSAPKAVQTYALEKHLLIAPEPVLGPIPGPCPPPNDGGEDRPD